MKHWQIRCVLRRISLPTIVFGMLLAGCDAIESDWDDGIDDRDVLATASFDETVPVSGQEILYLENVNGDIEVARSASLKSVRIEADLIAGSESERDAERWLDKLQVRISRRTRKVVVETDFPRDAEGRRLEVHYRVQIPEGFDVELRNLNGRITINDVTGHVDVEHMNGAVVVNNLHGTIDVHVMNGNIDCEMFLDHDGFAFLNTVNGQIRLHIPKTTSARLHGETGNGQVNFRDLTVSNPTGDKRDRAGTLGGGKGQIELLVMNGDIDVSGM